MDSATPARTGALLPEAARVAPPARQSLWLAVLVLTALNLRPFLTAIGPLASDIAAATGLDLRGMAWLTLLPMLLMGVAFVQAVFPGVIKRQFPGHVAPLMGLYSAALVGGGALGAQLTPLAAQGGAGRGALAWWALPVLAALLLAWRALPHTSRLAAQQQGASTTRWMLQRPRTWLLMLCFGPCSC